MCISQRLQGVNIGTLSLRKVVDCKDEPMLEASINQDHSTRSMRRGLPQSRNHVLPLMMRLPHLRRRVISRAGRADGGEQISGQQQKSDDVVVARNYPPQSSKGLPTKLGLLFSLARTSSAFDYFCAMRVASNA